MANNRFTGMMTGLDPQTARLVAAISGGPQNRNVSVQRNDPRLSNTIEADRVSRQQADMDQRHQSLGSIPKGLRQAAPVVAVLQSIASQMQRKGDNRKLDELYGQYQTKMDAQAQQEARAKGQAYQRQKADEKAKEQALMSYWKEKEQYKRDNPMPLTPEQKMALQEGNVTMQMLQQQIQDRRDKAERDRATFEQEQQEAAGVTDKKAKLKQGIKGDIAWLLDPARSGDMESATGSIQGAIPSIQQGTVDWDNRWRGLQSKLTGENLDMMDGILSESDIAILRDIANGGMNLRSGSQAITQGLQGIGTGLGMSFDSAPNGGSGQMGRIKNIRRVD